MKKGIEEQAGTAASCAGSYTRRSRFYVIHQAGVFGLLLLAVILALLMNTAKLRQQLEINTQGYALDVSGQLANNITVHLQAFDLCVRELADTYSRMPEFLLTDELLKKKEAFLPLDHLIVLNEDGTTIPADFPRDNLEQWKLRESALFDEANISYIGGKELFFSAPISSEAGNARVLVGVWSNDTLQTILTEADFRDRGLCCIIDQDGSMIVPPKEMAPFNHMEEIVQDTGSRDAAAIQKAVKDIESRTPGVVTFRSADGTPVMMAYDFLGINNWVLLTLIPQDLLIRGSGRYLNGYTVIIAGLLLVCGFILLGMYRNYRRTIRQLEAVSLTDLLTGGINGPGIQLRGKQLLEQSGQTPYAVIFLNIRNFKRFNTQLGVETCNQILLHIYSAIHAHLQDGELAARVEGDRFYLLLKCGNEEEVRARLDEILGEIEQRRDGVPLLDRTQIAQGACLINRQGQDFLILQDQAKIASLFQSETEPCRFYDAELEQKMERESRLDADFERAIRNREFQIYLQPKVAPGTGRLCGAEVLVRWQHPEYGLIAPGVFIPILEESGKICELDFYMLEETCRLLNRWEEEGRTLPLSVNLSRVHLGCEGLPFLDRIVRIKERYHIPDRLIELEVTESLVLERRQIKPVAEMLDRIRATGFCCSIDDFGFGYSSLTMLKDLNVDAIKLDRQFFLGENEKSWLVIGKFIELAHELGVTVVAEGIEDRRQVEQLRRLDCDMIQGYVYAKPLPVPEFQTWSAAWKEGSL